MMARARPSAPAPVTIRPAVDEAIRICREAFGAALLAFHARPATPGTRAVLTRRRRAAVAKARRLVMMAAGGAGLAPAPHLSRLEAEAANFHRPLILPDWSSVDPGDELPARWLVLVPCLQRRSLVAAGAFGDALDTVLAFTRNH